VLVRRWDRFAAQRVVCDVGSFVDFVDVEALRVRPRHAS